MSGIWSKHGDTIRRVALFWLVAVGIGAILRTRIIAYQPRTFLEIGIQAALIAFALTRPTIAAFVKTIPPPHKAILVVFFTIFYAGQFAQDLRLTYPFTAWAMYTSPQHSETLVYYRYRGHTRDGQPVELSPEFIVPSNDKHVVTSKLKGLIKAAFDSKSEDPAAGRRNLGDFLIAMARIYNLEHPEAPLQRIEVFEQTWNFRSQDRQQVKPKLLFETIVPADATS